MSIYTIISQIDTSSLPDVAATPEKLRVILQVGFGILGAIAAVVVTLTGIQYILSQGNPQETAKAQSALIYAAVGLAVCILAFSLTGLLISQVGVIKL